MLTDSPCTVPEVRKKKQQLEQNLLDLLRRFEQETGTSIYGINLDQLRTIAAGEERGILTRVFIRVSL